MQHGRHRRAGPEPNSRPLRQLGKPICAIASIAGLIIVIAVPAQASPAAPFGSPQAAAYSAYVNANAQSLIVSPTATADAGASRDRITATTQAELDAANAAAAARVAETDALAAIQAAQSTLAALGGMTDPTYTVVPSSGYTGPIVPATGTSGAAIVAYAEQFVGLAPYIASPTAVSPATGFECDSFVDWVFAHTTGRILPRGVNEIAALGTVIPLSQAVPGDLVVYPGKHIGIYAGGGTMVDAPAPGEYVKHQVIWGAPEFVRL
jgi:peptidoglycan DL-endopeptidase CwlO